MSYLSILRNTIFVPIRLNRKFRIVSFKTRISDIRKWLIVFSVTAITSLLLCGSAFSQEKNSIIRIAKLQIDSTQLEKYKTALKEEIEASIRIEPGVLSLYAVSDKNHPDQITIFEIYASADAYNAHRATNHFIKYKNATKEMVKSLELIEAVPILLGAKSK